MNRSSFFKTLVGVGAISSTTITPKEPEPERLSGRNRPITPEDLEDYIDRKINVKICGRITAKGKDLITVINETTTRIRS